MFNNFAYSPLSALFPDFQIHSPAVSPIPGNMDVAPTGTPFVSICVHPWLNWLSPLWPSVALCGESGCEHLDPYTLDVER
jgi:hypothetical protein